MKMKIGLLLKYVPVIFLTGMMIYGSFSKFEKPTAKAEDVIAKAQKYMDEDQRSIARLVIYVGGMRQTGYAWLLVGLSELIFGILLLIPRTRLIGGLFLLPITLNILLFHIFLEPEDIKELLVAIALLTSNSFIVIQLAKQKNFFLVKS
jgi:uncharacterized membrane protein YphA (DoxX/SURF4 family)